MGRGRWEGREGEAPNALCFSARRGRIFFNSDKLCPPNRHHLGSLPLSTTRSAESCRILPLLQEGLWAGHLRLPLAEGYSCV